MDPCNGPHLSVGRRAMWEELEDVYSWWNIPLCIGGDFNVVRSIAERRGQTGCLQECVMNRVFNKIKKKKKKKINMSIRDD